MLVVSLDALVCGLKLPRALRGFVQHVLAPAGFVSERSWHSAVRGFASILRPALVLVT